MRRPQSPHVSAEPSIDRAEENGEGTPSQSGHQTEEPTAQRCHSPACHADSAAAHLSWLGM
jgi:hypothetical protein